MPSPEQSAEEIFESALDLPPTQRSAYLAQACRDSPELLRIVEGLLSEYDRMGNFLDESPMGAYPGPPSSVTAAAIPHALAAGSKLGRYTVIEPLGAGGMSAVYRARDERLERTIAIKVLPTGVFSGVESRRRFRKEALALAKLSHPNIAPVYDVGEQDGVDYIVMECVAGHTLAATLRSGPLTVKEAASIVLQIAQALEEAHEQGVVHRDLKPANVMITPRGHVKVLDFGIAKLLAPTSSDSIASLTEAGFIVGTPLYMSPEQAQGHAVDTRADLWSLGVIFYECLTGVTPFHAASNIAIFHAIVMTEPAPVADLRPDAPPLPAQIVAKSLQKDPAARYQTAAEMIRDASDLLATLSATSTTPPATSVATRRPVLRPALALLVLAIVCVFGWLGGRHLHPKPTTPALPAFDESSLTQVTSSTGLDVYPSLSPDGSSLAYSSDQNGSYEIYVKSLTPGGRDMQLTSDGQDNLDPAWSPDGKYIAYASHKRGDIWVIPALGGSARRLTEFGSRPAWSPDSSKIAFQSHVVADIGYIGLDAMPPSTLWIVSVQGGTPTQLTHPGNPVGGHGAPSWSPDGNRIVFTTNDLILGEIWSISPQGGEPQPVFRGGAFNAVYFPDGRALYFSQKATAGNTFKLMRIPLAHDGTPSAPPQVLKDTGQIAYRHMNFSADGRVMAYSQDSTENNLWSIPISSKTYDALGPPQPLTHDTNRRKTVPKFSPDGNQISYTVLKFGPGQDIWLIDPDGKNPRSLNIPAGADSFSPGWFRGSKAIVIVTHENARSRWIVEDIDSGKTTGLRDDVDRSAASLRISPDGSQMAFQTAHNGIPNVWIAPVQGGPPRQLTFDKEGMDFPNWSPDGKFLTFEIKRASDSFLAVMPANGGPVIQLNADPGQSFSYGWSPDGDKISFAGQRNGIWNLYWISRTTRIQHQLTHYTIPSLYVRYPAWSPRGDQIVYEYAKTTGNIWLMKLK